MGNLCLSKQERPECKKLVADIFGLFKPSSTQGRKNGANAPFFCFTQADKRRGPGKPSPLLLSVPSGYLVDPAFELATKQ
jgi:hypothetical protein